MQGIARGRLPVLWERPARLLFGLFAMGASTIVLPAQSNPLPPLVTDRPGLYCGTYVMPPGVFQIEAGLGFERNEAGGLESEAILAPAVLRLGLLRSLEFRVSTTAVPRLQETTMNSRSSRSGISSPAVGLKWRFAEASEQSSAPSLALLFSLNLPAGSRPFRPDEPEPGLVLASDFALDGETTLSTNIGVSFPFDSDAGEHFQEVFYAVALGRSLGQRSGWFMEVAGTASSTDGVGSTLVVDGGVTHILTNDLQLDLSLIRGLTSETADWTVVGGISLRFY